MREVSGQAVICFSNIEWGIWKQRHHHLMERFARANSVLFVETVGMRAPNLMSVGDLRRIAGRLRRAAGRALGRGGGGSRPASLPRGLRVHSPLVVPFHDSAAWRRVNSGLLLRDLRRWLADEGLENPILWVYLPLHLILDVAEQLPHRLLVYDCVDAITEFRDAPASLVDSEARLLRRADLVLASSRPLLERCAALHPAAIYVPNAGEVERFASESTRRPEPSDLQAIPHPRVGYVGAIREWFDADLVRQAAERFPQASFVLVGDDTPMLAPLRRLANVHALGPRAYEDLPAYLGAMDVCIIPFRQTALIRHTHPIKVYEYLAAGRAVVSTPMAEIRHLTEVDQADAGEPFLAALGARLAEPRTPAAEARRRASIQGETWDARFRVVEAAVGDRLALSRPRAAEG